MLATLLSVSAVVVTSPSSPVKGRHTLCPVPSGLLSCVIGRHYRTPANRAHTGLPIDQIARALRAQQLLTRASQQSALAITSCAQSAQTRLPITNPRFPLVNRPLNYATYSNRNPRISCRNRGTIGNPDTIQQPYLAEYCHTRHNTTHLPFWLALSQTCTASRCPSMHGHCQ